MTQELVQFSMEPKSLDEAMKYAEIIAKSDLIPLNFKNKPGDVLVAIQWGQEVGLKPLQALQNIAVINGRPSLWGDASLSLVRASGLLEDFREDFEPVSFTATCTAKRKNQATLIVRTFSKADAEKAGLWDRNTWKSYPKRMAQMRARAFCLRDGFADVLKGMAIAEEQQDVVIDVHATPTPALPEPPAPPKRASESNGGKPAPVTSTDTPGTTDQPVTEAWKKFVAKTGGKCTSCEAEVPKGAEAYYAAASGEVSCMGCWNQAQTLA